MLGYTEPPVGLISYRPICLYVFIIRFKNIFASLFAPLNKEPTVHVLTPEPPLLSSEVLYLNLPPGASFLMIRLFWLTTLIFASAPIFSCAPNSEEVLEKEKNPVTDGGIFLHATEDPQIFHFSHCESSPTSEVYCTPVRGKDQHNLLFFETTGDPQNLDALKSFYPSSEDSLTTQLASTAALGMVGRIGSWGMKQSLEQALLGNKVVRFTLIGAATTITLLGRFSLRPSLLQDASPALFKGPPPSAADVAHLERIFQSTSAPEKGTEKPRPKKPLLPLFPPLEEVELNEEQDHLERQECLRELSQPSHAPLHTPNLERLAECQQILGEEFSPHRENETSQNPELSPNSHELAQHIDNQCLNTLFPMEKDDARPHIIKPPAHAPFAPTIKTPPSPKVTRFCEEHLENSPNQDLITRHKELYEEQQNSTTPGKKSDKQEDQAIPSTSRSTSVSSESAHSPPSLFTTEEICREILSRSWSGDDLSAHLQNTLKYCREFLEYLKEVNHHIKSEPISREALASSTWYRSKLAEHLKQVMYRPSLKEKYGMSLQELTEIVHYKQTLHLQQKLRHQFQSFSNSEEQSQLIENQLSEAEYLSHLSARVFELQNQIPEGSLREVLDELAQDPTPADLLLPTLEDHFSRWQQIKELYGEVELEDRPFKAPVPEKPHLEDVVREQITAYRHNQELAEKLAALRVQYFALIDGKKASNYSDHEEQTLKNHRILDQIRSLPPGEFLDPDLITAYLMELEKGLFHAYFTPKKHPLRRIFAKEISDEEHIHQLNKTYRKFQKNKTERISRSTGEHVRFLRLLLLAINQGIIMNELKVTDLFAVDQDPRLRELLNQDPYAAIPHELIMDNLETLEQQLKNTKRKHISPNPIVRFFFNPQLIQSSDKTLKKKIKGISDDDDFPLPSISRK